MWEEIEGLVPIETLKSHLSAPMSHASLQLSRFLSVKSRYFSGCGLSILCNTPGTLLYISIHCIPVCITFIT